MAVDGEQSGRYDQKVGLAGAGKVKRGEEAIGVAGPLNTDAVSAAEDAATENDDGVGVGSGGDRDRRVSALKGPEQQVGDGWDAERVQQYGGDKSEPAAAKEDCDENEEYGKAQREQERFDELTEKEKHVDIGRLSLYKSAGRQGRQRYI